MVETLMTNTDSKTAKILDKAAGLVAEAKELNSENVQAAANPTILPTSTSTIINDGDNNKALSSEPEDTLVTEDTLVSEAIPVAAAPAKSPEIIAAEKAVTDATDALTELEKNTVPDSAAIETAKATLKTATDQLTELNAAAPSTAAAAAPPAAAAIGGRRHSKRRHPKKGSRKSKKGGRSRKSKKGGRSRKNGSKHRKHSRAHKKH